MAATRLGGNPGRTAGTISLSALHSGRCRLARRSCRVGGPRVDLACGGRFPRRNFRIASRNWRRGSATARDTRRTCKQDGRGTKGPAELADGGLAVKNRTRVAELDEQANEQAQRPQGH